MLIFLGGVFSLGLELFSSKAGSKPHFGRFLPQCVFLGIIFGRFLVSDGRSGNSSGSDFWGIRDRLAVFFSGARGEG